MNPFLQRAVFAIVSTLFVVSCGADSSEEPDLVECRRDAECPGQQVCRQSICTVEETDPRRLGFRLTPPPGSTYPPQTVPIRELGTNEPVQIGLDPGVRVAGKVTHVGSDLGPGQGQLKFKRVGGNDGFTAEATVESNAYEVFVPAGTYDVTFFPANPDAPTRVWRGVEIELDTDPRLQFVAATVEIEGTLSRTEATTLESALVSGARVFATSSDTGVTSSSSVTDDSGDFSIEVPPDSGLYDLHVAPAQPNTMAPERERQFVPDATYVGAFEVEETDWVNLLDDNEEAASLSVSLGEYSYHAIQFPFSVTVDGLDDFDWTGTTVTLKTNAGRGTLSVRQQLDETGTFEAPLIIGEYEATIRTPPTSPVRSIRVPEIQLDETGIEFVVPVRDRVGGSVVSPSGEEISAQLTFTPVERGGLAEQVTIQTDDEGVFEVHLEDVEYEIAVIPTDSTRPRWVRRATIDDIPTTIEIAEPVLVWGTVFGTPTPGGENDDWRELADVSVRVLERTDGGTERIIGEGQTNERGGFKVVIGAR